MGTIAGGATVCERFQQTAARLAAAPALRGDDGRTWTWGHYAREVRRVSAGLAGLGLGPGDVSACWLRNRPEFHVADAGAMHLGVTSFSVFETSTADQAEQIIGDAGARVIVTEAAHVEVAIAVRDARRTDLEHIVCIDGDAPQALGWDELLELGPAGFDFESAWRAVSPEDLVTLIYTSSATGSPTGVELTHANTVAEVLALMDRLRLPRRGRSVSSSSMAHIGERLFTHYFPMFGGSDVRCCSDARRAAEAIQETRPRYLFSAPRLWEKLRSAVRAGADEAERETTAASIGRVRDAEGPQDGDRQRAARARVGLDELEVATVDAAPCPEELIVFWHALGVPLAELYCRSETTGVATVSAPDDVRIGTVGPPLSVCELRIAEDGEVLLRGPAVMRGYRNQPERTREAIDADGWLHSGDIGRLDPDGHLRIDDRVGGMIVTSTGERLSPADIEAALTADAALIDRACVVGDGRPYNVALLTLRPDAARRFAHELGLDDDLDELARTPIMLKAVRAEVAVANLRLSHAQQVERFLVLGIEWPADGTRRSIAAEHAAEIDGLYDGAIGCDARRPLLLARGARMGDGARSQQGEYAG